MKRAIVALIRSFRVIIRRGRLNESACRWSESGLTLWLEW
jgi:hypothetical protein